MPLVVTTFTFLVDRGGRVVGVARGARAWASPDGKALIRSLLDQKSEKEGGG